jgi:CDP-diacylglycerol--glycerol-3-phosphate 3-phosphatidyltransferase
VNLPNKLTVARLFCVPVFMVFTLVDNVHTRVLALVVFIGAGVTDLVDGYLARKYNQVTSLGVFLDPLADKLIIAAALVAFVELPETHVPAWMVVMIIGREFLITGLRALAASQGQIMAADQGGKFKTSVQTAAIITTLTVLIWNSALARFTTLRPLIFSGGTGWRAEAAGIMEWTPYFMALAATYFSLQTGVGYLYRHRRLFLSERK